MKKDWRDLEVFSLNRPLVKNDQPDQRLRINYGPNLSRGLLLSEIKCAQSNNEKIEHVLMNEETKKEFEKSFSLTEELIPNNLSLYGIPIFTNAEMKPGEIMLVKKVSKKQ